MLMKQQVEQNVKLTKWLVDKAKNRQNVNQSIRRNGKLMKWQVDKMVH